MRYAIFAALVSAATLIAAPARAENQVVYPTTDAQVAATNDAAVVTPVRWYRSYYGSYGPSYYGYYNYPSYSYPSYGYYPYYSYRPNYNYSYYPGWNPGYYYTRPYGFYYSRPRVMYGFGY